MAKQAVAQSQFLQTSENRHYFVKDGAPFFWLGDTIWPALSQYTMEDLELYFEQRAKQGFTIEHVALPWDGCFEHRHSDATDDGATLWLNGNPATPNERFFTKLDKVARLAGGQGLLLALLACGGAWGTYVHGRKIITHANAREYGRWLGRRYRDEPGIVWVNGFDLYPWMYDEVAHEFGAGIQEGDNGNHPIFYHPSGSRPGMSSNHFHQSDWLAGNFIQTWSDYWNIHGLVLADYHRKPPKPIVHVEGAYEAGTEYPSAPITSSIVRQQAYTAFLSGGFHTYGHNDIWRRTPQWREALSSPGSRQMRFLKDFFTSLPWWKLVPELTAYSVERGAQKELAAACSADGDFMVVYYPWRTTAVVDLQRITRGRPVRAKWMDPQSGVRFSGDLLTGESSQSITSPASCDDAVLLLEAEG